MLPPTVTAGNDPSGVQSIPETRKQKIIRSLREFADFLETRCVGEQFDSPLVYAMCWYRFDNKEQLASAISQVGGTFSKRFDQHHLNLRRDFGEIAFSLDIARDAVCKKVVSRKLVPARPEIVLPAEPEHEEEVVEWDCGEPILKGVRHAETA